MDIAKQQKIQDEIKKNQPDSFFSFIQTKPPVKNWYDIYLCLEYPIDVYIKTFDIIYQWVFGVFTNWSFSYITKHRELPTLLIIFDMLPLQNPNSPICL